ncbi:MAG: transporter substrate-binding domain-containing protein [Pseudomonadota bacterium]
MKPIQRHFLVSLVMVFWVCLNTTPAQSRELAIAFSYDIPPFIIEDGTKGLEIDIVREALQYKGYTFHIIQCSYKRLQVAVSNMGLDAAAAVREADDGTFYSDSFIAFRNFAITKKKAGLVINSIADLKGKTIYTWQNAYNDLGEEFKALFSPEVTQPYREKYKEIPVQAKQVESFWKGRDDLVIIIDEAIFKWFTRQLSVDVDTTGELVYHNLFENTTTFQVNFKERQIRDDFNEGLNYIRAKGLYQEILNRYR